jgi:pimeloyl-ACP methyl ester carboxylesterase
MDSMDIDQAIDEGTPSAEEARIAALRLQGRLQIQSLFLEWLQEATSKREQSGIEEEWRLAEDLYAGRYPEQGTEDIPVKAPKAQPGQSQIIINITKSKTNIAASQIVRRVLPGDMRPWECKPTPVPEFDEAIAGGNSEPVKLASGEVVEASKVAKAAKQMLKDKARRMADQIQDWLTDSGIYRGKTAYAELRKMIKNGARIGTGVIKGPFPAQVEVRRWRVVNGTAVIEVSKKIAPRILAIKAKNCYPDPSCGENIHNGRFFIERDYLTESQVRELANSPGYEPEDLDTVLKEGPQSWSRFDDRYKDERAGQVRIHDRSTFETFYLYASISPRALIGCGFQVPALTMPPGGLADDEAAMALQKQLDMAMSLTSIPIVATMINGRIVKVVLNPNEKGGFPYRFFRWSEVEDRPWGEGVPIQIAAAQLLHTAAVRAMSENAGQSAGAVTVMAEGLVQAVNQQYRLNRNSLFTFQPSQETGIDDVRKAFQLFTVPNVQKPLADIVLMAQEWADQLANIPLLMQGITGASPDTLGGMEMLEANAASPLLDIAKEYDEVVGPLISDFYDWGMQDPNVSAEAKGDFQCVGIGATHLIHRDRKALALQQIAAPMAGNPAFGLSPERTAEQVLRAVEIDPDDVKLTDEEKQQQQEQQQGQQDPRVQAATIKAQADADREKSRRESEEQERQFKAAMAKQQAIWDKALKDIDLQVQVLESARDRNLTADQIRATLAEAAMKIRDGRERFAAEMNFAMTAGHGRGL